MKYPVNAGCRPGFVPKPRRPARAIQAGHSDTSWVGRPGCLGACSPLSGRFGSRGLLAEYLRFYAAINSKQRLFAEDPDLWQRLHLDGLNAILLAAPDLDAKRFVITEIRRAGDRRLLSATNVHPEEASELLTCGCTTTYNYYEQAEAGFSERAWKTLQDGNSRPA